MKRRAFVEALGLGILGVLLTACGAAGGGKTANVAASAMPTGADWSGQYFDPVYGTFHLVQNGKTVAGKWERPHKEKWGELRGEVDQNLFRFTWTEYTIGAIGANAERTGRGYFSYSRPEGENVDDRLAGELGKGQDEVGFSLSCVKQRDKKPDPDSIGGTGASDIGGGDWDGDSKESGTPEPPAPPP